MLGARVRPEDQRRQRQAGGVQQNVTVGLRCVTDGLNIAQTGTGDGQGLLQSLTQRGPESLDGQFTGFRRRRIGSHRHAPQAAK